MQDDRPEKQPHWGNLPRIVLTASALLIAAGITMLVCRPDFFAVNNAEAARFSAQPASSAVSVSMPASQVSRQRN